LRFDQPQEVFIEKGYHGSYSGLTILNISGRGWEDKVQVLIDEAHPGMGFFASDVVEVPCRTSRGTCKSLQGEQTGAAVSRLRV